MRVTSKKLLHWADTYLKGRDALRLVGELLDLTRRVSQGGARGSRLSDTTDLREHLSLPAYIHRVERLKSDRLAAQLDQPRLPSKCIACRTPHDEARARAPGRFFSPL
jgi:hypothetical protein